MKAQSKWSCVFSHKVYSLNVQCIKHYYSQLQFKEFQEAPRLFEMWQEKNTLLNSFSRTNITVKLFFFFFFTFQITAFNCWHFHSVLYTSLRSICTVRVKLFKGYYHLKFYFKKVESIKMEKQINDIKSSTCPAATEPGGSAAIKTSHSRQCSSKRQLGRQQITVLPFPGCQDFRELWFCFSLKTQTLSVCGNCWFVFFFPRLHTMCTELQ